MRCRVRVSAWPSQSGTSKGIWYNLGQREGDVGCHGSQGTMGMALGSVPPHLKGYPNWTDMALISTLSPPHFTVAPVSPLKEPQAPKAKMAKSCGRGGAAGSGGLETLGTPPPLAQCFTPPGAESRWPRRHRAKCRPAAVGRLRQHRGCRRHRDSRGAAARGNGPGRAAKPLPC